MVPQSSEIPHLFFTVTGKPLQERVPLQDHSTFRIGGEADFFFQAENLDELKAAISFARRQRLPFYVIGAGSNLLFADEGYRGLLIKNLAKGIITSVEPPALEALSGTLLNEMVREAQEAGLSGLEFLAGIPGTVGGAVCGNAGAFGRSIGDVLSSAWILGERGEEEVGREFLSFRYRGSRVKEQGLILLKARFALERDEPEAIKKRVADVLGLRRLKHPPEGIPCAGSYFKNVLLPDGQKIAAGLLLDQAGVKGLRCGDAAVYSGHANFILNLGKARASDVLELAREMKKRVKERFGIELEEEVIYLEANASML